MQIYVKLCILMCLMAGLIMICKSDSKVLEMDDRLVSFLLVNNLYVIN